MSLVCATTTPGKPEIFASLQGEGASIGYPSTFVRLSRCNLACVWCDTPYTWHFSGDNRPHRGDLQFDRKANQITLPVEEVAQKIHSLPPRRLVVTGGEPLLQAGPLAHLLRLLPDFHVELETNGTIAVPAALDEQIDQYNVSPKLAFSGNATELALVPERLAYWAQEPRAWFKFVVSDHQDIEQVLNLRSQFSISSDRLFVMAEGTESAQLHERQKWLADLCIANNLRMADRLHIHLYGDTRGT
ncbi:MAG: 7-carboxy-7-deazaguanine synthase QueE [Sphingomonadaceae bacterium]